MKTRKKELDLIRTTALISIILNHALNTVWDATNYNFWINTNIINKIMMLLLYTLCRFGVPLFLMLSGILILKKEFNNFEDIKKFYKHNLLSLIIAVEFWNILYYLFMVSYNHIPFDIKNLIYILLFMKESLMPHMWYMPMIIGMYIVMPFISVIVKKFNFKCLLFPFALGLLSFSVLPNLQVLLRSFGFEANNIRMILDLKFYGGIYGLYAIIGYYIYNENLLKNIKKRNLIICFVFFVITSMIFQGITYINQYKYIIYYNFIGVFLGSIFLFEWLRRIKCTNNINRIVKQISINSLAIYFLHRPILFILKNIISLKTYDIISIFIYLLLCIFLSVIIIKIFKRNKFVRKKLLLIKE